jgi:hypothetical protein
MTALDRYGLYYMPLKAFLLYFSHFSQIRSTCGGLIESVRIVRYVIKMLFRIYGVALINLDPSWAPYTKNGRISEKFQKIYSKT